MKQWSNPEIKAKHCGENNGMYGKHHSEETKQRLREIHKNKKHAPKQTRQVLCVELNKIYKNASVAAKELYIASSNILHVCKGLRKTAGGYHWQFYYGK